MPRYHFHVKDGQYLADPEGVELSDLAAAREQAVSAYGEILRDSGRVFWDQKDTWHMYVTDDANQLLFTLNFSADELSQPRPYQPPQ